MIKRFLPTFRGLSVLALLLLAGSLQAATFTVTKTADTNDGTCDADCSLREAITDANVSAGADEIVFDSGVTGTITLGSTLPNPTDDLTITGPGLSVLTIDADASSRIIGFSVGTSKTLNISGLTMTNGKAGGQGGAIIKSGVGDTLNLSSCAITNSEATGANAGGIFVQGGTFTLTDCTVSGNTTGINGGGIVIDQVTAATITRSTISGNHATSLAGGIFVLDGTLVNIINSTISGNTANTDGGGIRVQVGTVNLSNVTIANNTADNDDNGSGDSGGLHRSGGTVNVKNTIIADNVDKGDDNNDCGGTIQSGDYNLIEDTTSCNIQGTTTNNITGQDPVLGALASNGGSTQTHSLNSGSPAIDAGNSEVGCEDQDNTDLTTDQRGAGFTRPADGDNDETVACDIGSFEVSCGDGVLQTFAGEDCDDDNASNTDACLNSCEDASCGDGFIEAGSAEECDNGGGNSDSTADACRTDCTDASCSDSTVDTGEGCDDGNASNTDSCLNTCAAATCGDGVIQAGSSEECDDGNDNSDSTVDACRTTCVEAACGDSNVDTGEECDDGNSTNTDACLTTCVSASCGDGVVQTGEEDCDDSNTDDDDGCSATCTVEENDELEDDNPTIDFSDLEVGDTVTLNTPDPTQNQSLTIKDAADPTLCTCTWSINPTTRGSFSDETVCQADFTLAEAGNANLQVAVDCGDDGSETYNQTLTITAASSDSGGGGSGGCSLIRHE